jgi:hypothetical protein
LRPDINRSTEKHFEGVGLLKAVIGHDGDIQEMTVICRSKLKTQINMNFELTRR